jgi:hypothetical protein
MQAEECPPEPQICGSGQAPQAQTKENPVCGERSVLERQFDHFKQFDCRSPTLVRIPYHFLIFWPWSGPGAKG